MNEHELQQLTEEISRTSFHREFTHKSPITNAYVPVVVAIFSRLEISRLTPLSNRNWGLKRSLASLNTNSAIITCIKLVAAIVTEILTLNASFIKWAEVALSNA